MALQQTLAKLLSVVSRSPCLRAATQTISSPVLVVHGLKGLSHGTLELIPGDLLRMPALCSKPNRCRSGE